MNQDHQRETEGGEQPPDPDSPETEPASAPRIYVASLADYNAGILLGEWIDAHQTPEELHDQTSRVLSRSTQPDAEEWAIHDHEGFGPAAIGEHTDLAAISRLAKGITEHGPAYAHWANYIGSSSDDQRDGFEDAYLGEWSSVADYAEHVLDDLGYIDEINAAIPEHLRHYVKVDIDGFARDLGLSGDIYSSETPEGTVHLFETHA